MQVKSNYLINDLLFEKYFESLVQYLKCRILSFFPKEDIDEKKIQLETIEILNKMPEFITIISNFDNLDPLYLTKNYSSQDCQKLIIYYLLDHLFKNTFNSLQYRFFKSFSGITDVFFTKWEGFSKKKKQTFEIVFFLFLAVLHGSSEFHKSDESLLDYYESLFVHIISNIVIGLTCEVLVIDQKEKELLKEIVFSRTSQNIFTEIHQYYSEKMVDMTDQVSKNLMNLLENFFANTYVESTLINYVGLRGICFPNGLCVLSKEAFEMDGLLRTINIVSSSGHELIHLYKYYFSLEGADHLLFKTTPRKEKFSEQSEESIFDPQMRNTEVDAGDFYESKVFGVNKMFYRVDKLELAEKILLEKPWLNPFCIADIHSFNEKTKNAKKEGSICSPMTSGQLSFSFPSVCLCFGSWGEWEKKRKPNAKLLLQGLERELDRLGMKL